MKMIYKILLAAGLCFGISGYASSQFTSHQLLSEIIFKDISSCSYKWIDNDHVKLEIGYESGFLEIADILAVMDLSSSPGSIFVTAYGGEANHRLPNVKKIQNSNGPNKYVIIVDCSMARKFSTEEGKKLNLKWYYRDSRGIHDIK